MQKDIKTKFGEKALDFALFYNHENSLRFKLSSGSCSIEMFVNAYNRSKAIVDFAFQNTETISICLAFTGSGSFLANLSIFRALKECRISIPKEYFTWQKLYRDKDNIEESKFERTFICFNIPKSEVSKFLWGTLANELGIRPRSRCDLYLFDLKTSILLHPYDDRGMDIIGSNKDKLKQLYDRFNEWLLDYDREKMKSNFDI